jgi:hypothetical protein
MPAPEEMSRDELIVLVRAQAEAIVAAEERVAAQDARIAALTATNEEREARLARLEHLLSRNSGNSSMPPSRDDDPGKTPPAPKEPKRRGGGVKRKRGKQPGAPGSYLAWTENPDETKDRFLEGRCDCGRELAAAADLGIVDRYQQHEIPLVSVTITQYDQHQVRCGAVAGRPTPLPDRTAPAPARSDTGRTCRRSRCI